MNAASFSSRDYVIQCELPVRESSKLGEITFEVTYFTAPHPEAAETSGVRHRGHERRRCVCAHPGLDDRMLDVEQIAQRCAQHDAS